MKLLESLIAPLDEEKSKLFIKSIQNSGSNCKGKEIELFKAIQKNSTLKIANKNAYHSNRKRLVIKLISFIYLDEVESLQSSKSTIESYLSVANYLYQHNTEKPAWNLLLKAEKLAHKHELYQEINQVYLMQIELYSKDFAPNLSSILNKHQQNKEIQLLDERMTIGVKLIENELQKIILIGESKQFYEILTKVSNQLQLSDGIISNPKFAYQFLSISRNITKAQKTYHQFEPFVIQTYQTLKEQNAFKPNHQFYQLSILYMLCHSLYRIRKFDILENYLNEFESIINTTRSSSNKLFYAKLILLKASHFALTNQLENAITLLNTNYSSFSITEKIAQNLNLGLYYFMNKEHSKALQTNNKIGRSEKWLEKKLGLEWVMKKQLMEIIIHYELENLDLVETFIRSFETKFSPLLKLNKYARVKPFIKFIKKRINLKEVNLEEIELYFTQIDVDKEDLQAMIFYAWLKAKIQKKDFYECLLDMVRGL